MPFTNHIFKCIDEPTTWIFTAHQSIWLNTRNSKSILYNFFSKCLASQCTHRVDTQTGVHLPVKSLDIFLFFLI